MKYAILTAICFLFIACGTAPVPNGDAYIKEGHSVMAEGWINDDTFRVIAIGFPKTTLTEQARRRFYAKEAAIITAQKNIIEKFKGARLQGTTTTEGGEVVGMKILKEFTGAIVGGTIVSEKYDEFDNCQIIYDVSSPGLKKRVTFGLR